MPRFFHTVIAVISALILLSPSAYAAGPDTPATSSVPTSSSAPAAPSTPKPKKTSFLSVTPTIGGILFSSKDSLNPAPLYGVRIGYDKLGSGIVNTLGVEGTLNYFNTTTKGTKTNASGYLFKADAVYVFSLTNKLVPFVAAGAGDIYISKDNDSSNDAFVEYGLGLKYFFHDWLSLRVDLRHMFVYHDVNTRNNFEISSGLTYTFGKEHKKPAPAKKPAEAPKVAVKPVEPLAPLVLDPIQDFEMRQRLDAVGPAIVGIGVEPLVYPAVPLPTMEQRRFQAFKGAPTTVYKKPAPPAPAPAKPAAPAAAPPKAPAVPAPGKAPAVPAPGKAPAAVPAPAKAPAKAPEPAASPVPPGTPSPAGMPAPPATPAPVPAVPAPMPLPDGAPTFYNPEPQSSVAQPAARVAGTPSGAAAAGPGASQAPAGSATWATSGPSTGEVSGAASGAAAAEGSAAKQQPPAKAAVKPQPPAKAPVKPQPQPQAKAPVKPQPPAPPQPQTSTQTFVSGGAEAEPEEETETDVLDQKLDETLDQTLVETLAEHQVPVLETGRGSQAPTAPLATVRKKVHLFTIEFDFAKADIRPRYDEQLAKMAGMIKGSRNPNVLIEGHTDNIGKAAPNATLSLKRANAVKKKLISLGVPASTIRTAGFGFSRPVSSNTTAEGRQRNRRAETIIIILTEP